MRQIATPNGLTFLLYKKSLFLAAIERRLGDSLRAYIEGSVGETHFNAGFSAKATKAFKLPHLTNRFRHTYFLRLHRLCLELAFDTPNTEGNPDLRAFNLTLANVTVFHLIKRGRLRGSSFYALELALFNFQFDLSLDRFIL